MKPSSLARSLHILGPVLGRKRGVQVRIGGARACTEGSTIWLPALPLDDDEAAALGFGLLFHEANHVRYTDFSVDKDEGVVGALTNALEDIRVDALGQQEYRGGRAEEEALVAALVRRGEAKACTSGDHPARILESYVIWRLEHALLGIEAARGMAARAEGAFGETFPADLKAKLDARIFAVRDCRSTSEVRELAQELAQLLGDAAAALPPCPCARSSPAAARALRQVLEATASDHAGGIGELAQAAVNAKCREAPLANLSLSRSAPPRPIRSAAAASFALEVKAATNALRHRLLGLLQAETLCRRYRAASGGHVDMRHLGRIEVGDARIFVRDVAGLKTDTAVQILLDRSGSMGSSRGREGSGPRPIEVARESCYATALALEQLPGVAVAAAAFPGYADAQLTVMARFDERIERQASRFASLEAGGGTPLAEAMLWAAGELLGQRESRRILLVATDGAYDEKLGRAMTARLDGAGIEALGIGMGCDVSHLFAHSRPIGKLADLPQAMFELLREAIRRRAGTRSCEPR